jgi:DNA-binding NtrC family response regulator
MAQEAVGMIDRNRGNWSPQLSLLEFAPAAEADDGPLEGGSEIVRRVRQRAAAIARTGYAAAVIAGEAGSGKHRVARWLHRHGSRGDAPLASVDAGAPDAASAVAELEAGLRTGPSPGSPGNLVVHNVHRAGAPLIRRLLELLSRQPAPLRCGLLLLSTAPAATLRSRSLEHEQLIGRSTSALLEVPPLRARLDDVPVVARSFLAEAASHYDRTIRGLSPQALARLQRHAFPGNLRELRLVLEQAVLRGTADWITLDDLGLGLPTPESKAAADRAELVVRLPGASLREVELQTIRLALRLCDGRLVRAADVLGITRHALRRKLEKYNLDELRQRGPGTDDEDEDEDAVI